MIGFDSKLVHNSLAAAVQMYAAVIEDYERRVQLLLAQVKSGHEQMERLAARVSELEGRILKYVEFEREYEVVNGRLRVEIINLKKTIEELDHRPDS